MADLGPAALLMDNLLDGTIFGMCHSSRSFPTLLKEAQIHTCPYTRLGWHWAEQSPCADPKLEMSTPQNNKTSEGTFFLAGKKDVKS